jgi:hypothetical protein
MIVVYSSLSKLHMAESFTATPTLETLIATVTQTVTSTNLPTYDYRTISVSWGVNQSSTSSKYVQFSCSRERAYVLMIEYWRNAADNELTCRFCYHNAVEMAAGTSHASAHAKYTMNSMSFVLAPTSSYNTNYTSYYDAYIIAF